MNAVRKSGRSNKIGISFRYVIVTSATGSIPAEPRLARTIE